MTTRERNGNTHKQSQDKINLKQLDRQTDKHKMTIYNQALVIFNKTFMY